MGKNKKNRTTDNTEGALNKTLAEKVLGLLKRELSPLTKNEIARQLNISSSERIELKNVLLELCATHKLARGNKRRYELVNREWGAGMVFVAKVEHLSNDGDLEIVPVKNISNTKDRNLDEKIIVAFEAYKRIPGSITAINQNSLLLVRLNNCDQGFWQADLIRILKKPSSRPTTSYIGVIAKDHKGAYLYPTDRRQNKLRPAFLPEKVLASFKEPLDHHDVVVFEDDSTNGMRIVKKLGLLDDPKTFIAMAVHQHKLPHQFSHTALEDANQSEVPTLGRRDDLRHLPFVTIDGEDARDFDDAVWAEPVKENGKNGISNQWRLIVAIADVAHYVYPGTELDHEARLRGNSVYFPNGVIPMLPEVLSNGLCSLRPNEDRACLAIDMTLSSTGKIISYKLKRVLIRSVARLTYKQVQNFLDKDFDSLTFPHVKTLEETITPLYEVFKALRHNRDQRGALDIESSERKVLFNENGHVDKIVPYERWESHQLIEECMIAANVCAAKILQTKKSICVYRIHDRPDALKVQNLKQFANRLKLSFSKASNPQPEHFNDLLHSTRNTPYKFLINDLVLRSQSQAQYSTQNVGHYGLGLAQYAHFTSPIRRYSDLIVHRLLLEACDLGEPQEFQTHHEKIEEICQHLCTTERLAAVAERDVMDRFMGHYYENDVGKTFPVIIVGVTNAGLFVSHSTTGAQGFIPKSSLPGDLYFFDQSLHRLIGRRNKKSFQLGDYLNAKLIMADIFTASLLFEIEGPGQDGSSYSKRKNFDRSDSRKSAKHSEKERQSSHKKGKREKTHKKSSKKNKGKNG